MHDPRTSLLLEIFAELSKRAVHYAVLHGGTNSPPPVRSDVDIAFTANPAKILEPIFQDLQQQGKAVLVGKLHYDVPYGYYYVLAMPSHPRSFLMIDGLYDPFGINRYRLSTVMLLIDRIREPWGYRVSPRMGALYLLSKRSAKGEISEDKLRSLRESVKSCGLPFNKEVSELLGFRDESVFDQILNTEDSDQAGVVLKEIGVGIEKEYRRRRFGRFLLGKIWTILRLFRRFIQPTGLFVVLVGPDGVGKSTVRTEIIEATADAFRRRQHFHWRPGILPKLGRPDKTTDRSPAIQDPPKVSKYSGLVSYARFFYYWLDFIIGYWLVVYPQKAQTGLVIAERYFPDVIVNPARYGFALPHWLMRLAARLVPQPDILILLKANPAAIHQRKPELTVEEIGHQICLFESELNHWDDAIVLDVHGSAEVVAREALDLIIEKRASLTARNIGRQLKPTKPKPIA